MPNATNRTRTIARAVALWALAALPLNAQTAISVYGAVETTGGLRFPDSSIQTTSSSGGFAPVEDTGQQACWGLLGTPIPCSGTGQDGDLQKGVDWPTPRFTDNEDGTVTDTLTGLIWLRDTTCAGTLWWADATYFANALGQGYCGLFDGSSPGDWRLPNIKELQSLIDFGQSNPALPMGHPFEVSATPHWSSTTNRVITPQAFYVDLADGTSLSGEKTSDAGVLLVRGGR